MRNFYFVFQIRALCGDTLDNLFCTKPCARLLDKCGHRCTKLCREDCGQTVCQVRVPLAGGTNTCAHSQMVPCFTRFEENCDVKVDSCEEICRQIIPSCGHTCLSKCSDCVGGNFVQYFSVYYHDIN